MTIVVYKLVLMIIVSLFFVCLAFRIREKIILEWVRIIARFALRPHIYVFDKNTDYCRDPITYLNQNKSEVITVNRATDTQHEDNDKEDFDYEGLVRDPEVGFRFTKKGLLVIKST